MDTLGSSSKPREKTSNPSEYGYLYSAEREAPPPEVGWTEKQTQEQKISLYSENVVKEGDTTETVDRESIANLSTTKRQWENIFTTHGTSTPQGDSTLKKKGTPKWEVRVPYTEKRPAPVVSSTNQEEPQNNGAKEDSSEEDSEMFKKPEDTESAIEREIRLAHEREEMLRKEKEERQKQTDRQQKSQGQTIIASYEAVSAESESCQPAYNELTEADRGPDLWGVEAGVRKEDDSASEASAEEANPNESIIEREIRLQREREEEISRMRKQSSSSAPKPKEQPQQQQQQQQPQQQQQVHSPPPPPAYVPDEEEEDVNHNQSKMTSYEDSIANTNHDGESLIARELRELKEREEEMRKLHESLHGTRITDEVDGPAQDSYTSVKPSSLNISASSQRPSQSSPSPAQGTWQRDVSPFVSQKRKESVDSTSSHSTGRAPSDTTPSRRDVRVQPLSDGHDDDDEKPNYFQKQETPIEREMRIARERENELRRLKGLPEIVQKDDDPYGSYGASPEQISNSTSSRPRSLGQPNDSMKKFASSRLQQELLQQKERELALRNEGKIISTSEEHIEPLKYMSVAGVDKVDGTEKRNFVTKKTSVSSYVEPESPSPAQEVTSPGAQAGQPTRKKSGVAAGGQLFSYKEFKQTAESKIERELREMREREEELRMQRTGAQPETPR